MEILFLIVSASFGTILVLTAGSCAYRGWDKLQRACDRDVILMIWYFACIIMASVLIFMTMCAINNTFWKLPYIFN